jgi:hypothetical protein
LRTSRLCSSGSRAREPSPASSARIARRFNAWLLVSGVRRPLGEPFVLLGKATRLPIVAGFSRYDLERPERDALAALVPDLAVQAQRFVEVAPCGLEIAAHAAEASRCR